MFAGSCDCGHRRRTGPRVHLPLTLLLHGGFDQGPLTQGLPRALHVELATSFGADHARRLPIVLTVDARGSGPLSRELYLSADRHGLEVSRGLAIARLRQARIQLILVR